MEGECIRFSVIDTGLGISPVNRTGFWDSCRWIIPPVGILAVR